MRVVSKSVQAEDNCDVLGQVSRETDIFSLSLKTSLQETAEACNLDDNKVDRRWKSRESKRIVLQAWL
ncbi:hypothetical protein GOP47_0029932 [Adiantum capillus-veneris]|nr:hypothetical protein GOP47_0029932 [Adiantum capillus-veneris]